MASESFINHLAQVLYGDENTKHDKQNIKKKYIPIMEGKASLTIKDISKSEDFLNSYYSMFSEVEEVNTVNAILRNKIKKHKIDEKEKSRLHLCYHETLTQLDLLRNDYNKLRDDKIDEYNNHPHCIKLNKRMKILEDQLSSYKYKYDEREKSILNDKNKYTEYIQNYAEKKQELDEEFEKRKQVYIKRAKQELKEEEKLEIKSLKEDIKKLKKKITKRDRSIETLEKELVNLQKMRIKNISDSDSDSDSD